MGLIKSYLNVYWTLKVLINHQCAWLQLYIFFTCCYILLCLWSEIITSLSLKYWTLRVLFLDNFAWYDFKLTTFFFFFYIRICVWLPGEIFLCMWLLENIFIQDVSFYLETTSAKLTLTQKFVFFSTNTVAFIHRKTWNILLKLIGYVCEAQNSAEVKRCENQNFALAPLN